MPTGLGIGSGLPLLGQALFYPDATLAFDFTTGSYRVGAGGFSTPDFSSLAGLTVSRASVGYAERQDGTLVQFGNNVARITDKGLLDEESRTNSIRNSAANNGAVAGTPGTLPTNWASFISNGLSIQVVGTGTDPRTSLPCIDVRFFGTTSGSGGVQVIFETSTGIPAANGQTWVNSVYAGISGGALPGGATAALNLDMFNAGAFLSTLNGGAITPNATVTRYSQAFTTNNASTTAVRPYFALNTSGTGVVVDITLRFVAPQCEQISAGSASIASSYIPTTSAAATRAADMIGLSFSPGTVATFIAAADIPNADGIELKLLTASDGTSSNRTILRRDASNNANVISLSGASTVYNQTIAGKTGARALKIGAAFDGANYRAAADGVAMSAGSGAAPVGLNTLSLGTNFGAGGNWLNGYLRSVIVYPSAFSSAQLQAATQ